MRGLHVLFALFLALLAIVTSCAQPQQPVIEVTPAMSTLVSLQSAQLTVTRRFPGGGPVEQVTNQVTYTSSNRNVASVDGAGVVTAGDEPGTVVIRAYDAANDAVGTATFTVESPRIESIDIVPSPAVVLRPDTSVQMRANARMNDGTTRDVTKEVLWASSNVAVAMLDLMPPNILLPPSIGVVTAVSNGETTITATDSATRVQGRTIVFVSGDAPQLRAIVVTPNPATMAVGQTGQLTAHGIHDDGSRKNITTTVTWSSSNEAVVAITASGLATSVAAGEATITAAAPDPGAPGMSMKGSAAIVVQ